MDCTKDAPLPMCFSFNHEIVGSEDCLYLEVSTAAMSPDTPLPVMFWVGGCGFAWYMDDICDPTLLIDQNVIFVRCGFRLGPFGFLSINDYTAPGNNGLKDIVLALKWVQRNISAFGGDPQNVTLFGNSSGGACIHLLILSPMASGLFHKAILQSASALNNWSLAKNPHQPVMELAKQLGVTKTCKMEIIEELKSIPALKLMQALYALEIRVLELDKNDTFDSIFKPCIEEEFEGQPAFLTKSPPIIIKSGNFNKVPFIIGSNNIEGSVIQFIKSDFYTDFKKYNENLGLIVPRPLVGDSTVSKAIGQQLLRFYLDGEESLTEDTRNQYLQLLSDYYFLYYVNKTVQLHSQFAPECPIYYYVINSAGEWSVPDNLKFLNSLGHCAEYPFVFRLHCDNHSNSSAIKGSRDSILMRSRIVKMWTNFAKYRYETNATKITCVPHWPKCLYISYIVSVILHLMKRTHYFKSNGTQFSTRTN